MSLKQITEGKEEIVKVLDVVTTSGPATASPADLTKLAHIRETIGPTKTLALASGVSAENVGPCR